MMLAAAKGASAAPMVLFERPLMELTLADLLVLASSRQGLGPSDGMGAGRPGSRSSISSMVCNSFPLR